MLTQDAYGLQCELNTSWMKASLQEDGSENNHQILSFYVLFFLQLYVNKTG